MRRHAFSARTALGYERAGAARESRRDSAGKRSPAALSIRRCSRAEPSTRPRRFRRWDKHSECRACSCSSSSSINDVAQSIPPKIAERSNIVPPSPRATPCTWPAVTGSQTRAARSGILARQTARALRGHRVPRARLDVCHLSPAALFANDRLAGAGRPDSAKVAAQAQASKPARDAPLPLTPLTHHSLATSAEEGDLSPAALERMAQSVINEPIDLIPRRPPALPSSPDLPANRALRRPRPARPPLRPRLRPTRPRLRFCSTSALLFSPRTQPPQPLHRPPKPAPKPDTQRDFPLPNGSAPPSGPSPRRVPRSKTRPATATASSMSRFSTGAARSSSPAAFAIVRGAAVGWSARGDEPNADAFTQVSIPLDAGSVFRTVAMTRGSYVGPLPPVHPRDTTWSSSAGCREPSSSFPSK